jgi:hypothetical protein
LRRAVRELPDGGIKLGTVAEADDSLHPGLHPIAAGWIAAATSLGLKFLRAPRIGAPRLAAVLSPKNFAEDEDPKRRQERFSEVVRAVEERGVGMAPIRALGERIKARTGSPSPWYQALNKAKDEQERAEIKKAVREWADGDTVAAHIAYGDDVLCTGDKAETSIFSEENRTWLKEKYGIRIMTLKELAAELCQS